MAESATWTASGPEDDNIRGVVAAGGESRPLVRRQGAWAVNLARPRKMVSARLSKRCARARGDCNRSDACEGLRAGGGSTWRRVERERGRAGVAPASFEGDTGCCGRSRVRRLGRALMRRGHAWECRRLSPRQTVFRPRGGNAGLASECERAASQPSSASVVRPG